MFLIQCNKKIIRIHNFNLKLNFYYFATVRFSFLISMSNNKFSFSRDYFSLTQLKSRSAIANRLSIKSLYFAAMSDDVRAFTTAVGLLLLLI
jgi:hypothetical protein